MLKCTGNSMLYFGDEISHRNAKLLDTMYIPTKWLVSLFCQMCCILEVKTLNFDRLMECDDSTTPYIYRCVG